MRIRAKTVEITASESSEFSSPATFRTFEDANTFLRGLARSAPGPGGGYHKTDFTITFVDDETYKGRIDLTSHESPDLGAHVRKFVEFYSGSLHANELPSHISTEQYRAILLRDMSNRDQMIHFRELYELGDPTTSSLTKAK